MKLRMIGGGVLFIALQACGKPPVTPDKSSISTFEVETIAAELSSPWSVAAVGNGSYFVTEKTGGLKFIDQAGAVTDISGLPDDIHVDQQGGLLEVALPSTFVKDDTIYLSYASGDKKANGTKLFKARLQGSELVDDEVIFEATPSKDTGSHFGGRIVFLPDNTLVLALGDGFSYREEAQNKASHLGKIVRLNLDGSIPDDNPFVGEDGAAPEVFSFGHRNVQGLHYDSVSGDLWAHEHGPKGGDELNLITKGTNYGWPLATTGVDYNGAKITPYQTFEGTQIFVKDWVPSIAPSGLTIYRGDMFPDWNGDALVGGLASRDLRRIDLEDGKFVGEEILLGDFNARIRDVRIDVDGAILVVTDDPGNGEVLRLTPKNK